MADTAFAYFFLTIPAEDSFAIDTFRSQTMLMGQMSIVTKVDSLPGSAAHITNQQLQFV
jgi:hypothetical protein